MEVPPRGNIALTITCLCGLITMMIIVSKNLFYGDPPNPHQCEWHSSKTASACLKSAEDLFCASLANCSTDAADDFTTINFSNDIEKNKRKGFKNTKTNNVLKKFADLQLRENESGPKFSVTRLNDFKWGRNNGASVVKLFGSKGNYKKKDGVVC